MSGTRTWGLLSLLEIGHLEKTITESVSSRAPNNPTVPPPQCTLQDTAIDLSAPSFPVTATPHALHLPVYLLICP